MRLADLKAEAARRGWEVMANRFVPRGQAIMIDWRALGIDSPRTMAVHPDDMDTDDD